MDFFWQGLHISLILNPACSFLYWYVFTCLYLFQFVLAYLFSIFHLPFEDPTLDNTVLLWGFELLTVRIESAALAGWTMRCISIE